MKEDRVALQLAMQSREFKFRKTLFNFWHRSCLLAHYMQCTDHSVCRELLNGNELYAQKIDEIHTSIFDAGCIWVVENQDKIA